MSNYVKSTNFTSKDSLALGDPLKIVKGAEIDTEFNNIATAVATKADIASPTFTGTPAAPTASAGTNTTQIATTAFVTSNMVALTGAQTVAGVKTFSDGIVAGSVTSPTITLVSAGWSIVETAGVLYFKYNGVNKAKLDSSGNFTVTGDITAFGSV